MKYMFKAVMVLLVVFVVTGCSIRNVKQDFSFKEGGDSGLLFMSVTQPQTGPINGALTKIDFDGVKKGSVTSLEESMFGGSPSFKEVLKTTSGKGLFGEDMQRDFEDRRGRVILIELPAGDYGFFSWRSSAGNVGIRPSSTPPKVDFTIKNGEVTYAGNYHLVSLEGENIFRMTLLAGVYPVVSDTYDRDLQVMHKNYPAMTGYKVNKDIRFEGLWASEGGEFDRDIAPVYIPPAQ